MNHVFDPWACSWNQLWTIQFAGALVDLEIAGIVDLMSYTLYRESQKPWDLEDDLRTFNRNSNKIEKPFNLNKHVTNLCDADCFLFQYLSVLNAAA